MVVVDAGDVQSSIDRTSDFRIGSKLSGCRKIGQEHPTSGLGIQTRPMARPRPGPRPTARPRGKTKRELKAHLLYVLDLMNMQMNYYYKVTKYDTWVKSSAKLSALTKVCYYLNILHQIDPFLDLGPIHMHEFTVRTY
jgi:hypothetical protein